MTGILSPVRELIASGDDLENIAEALWKLYPRMDRAALVRALTQAGFMAELWGRVSARRDING
jgi:phage gp29-like protein